MCGMAASVIGAVSSLAGSMVAAQGAAYQAAAQEAQMKAQAAWQSRQASVEHMKTSYAIAQQKRKTRAMLGAQQAQYGAAGIDPVTGTPLQVGEATIQERAMDEQATRLQGSEEMERNIYGAKTSLMQAESAKQAGKYNVASAIISGIGNAAGALQGVSLGGMFSGGSGGTASGAAFVGAGTRQATPIAISQPILPNNSVPSSIWPDHMGP